MSIEIEVQHKQFIAFDDDMKVYLHVKDGEPEFSVQHKKSGKLKTTKGPRRIEISGGYRLAALRSITSGTGPDEKVRGFVVGISVPYGVKVARQNIYFQQNRHLKK